MKKKLEKSLFALFVSILVFSSIITTAFAAEVSSWGSLIFYRITSYDGSTPPNSIDEPLNESIFNPATTYQHYKDKVVVRFKSGSITQVQLILDGTPLTDNDMTWSYVQKYQSTFKIYYWECTYTLYNLADIADPDTARSILQVITHGPTDASLTSAQSLHINWIDSRPDAPTTPTFIYNDPSNPGQAVLTGVDDTMEYRLQSDYTGWNGITGDSVVFSIPAQDTGYYVRYVNPESKSKVLILKAVPPAPSISLNPTTEQFTGLDTTMEMKINDGDFFPVTAAVLSAGATPYIDAINAGSTTTVHIRVRASEVSPQGPEMTLPLYPRSAAPTGVSYDPVNTTLSGVTTAMQYRAQGGTWADVTGTTQNVEGLVSATGDVTLEIRYKAVSGVSSASSIATVTLNQLPTAPALSLNLTREVVTGFDTSKSYQYNTTGSLTTWSAVPLTNGEFDVSQMISWQNAVNIYIRETKTGTTAASASILFAVPIRPTAPTTAYFVYNDPNHPGQAVVAGLNTGMEFRRSADTVWTPYTGSDIVVDIPTSMYMYCYVRYPSQGSQPNSTVQNLTLLARANAPSVTLNTTSETIGTVSTAMEISTDGINYTKITSGTIYDVSGIINVTATGTTSTVYIRTAATSTAPASLSKSFVLYPRSAAPTGITYDPVNCIVSGVSTAMQYRAQGGSTWTAISATTLNVESLLSSTGDVVIEIRYNSVSGVSSASPSTSVALAQLPTAPSLSMDLTREVVTGFTSGKSYQYVTSTGSSWSTVTLSSNEFSITSLISSSASVTLYIREAKTSTAPASARATFTIAARSAAPTTPQFVFNNAAHPEQAVLTGLGATMEYRKSTDSAWTSCTGDDVLFDIPSSSLTYYIRTKSSGSTVPASNYKTIYLYSRSAAPTVTLNTTTETVGTVSSAMEVSTNGVNYTSIPSGVTAYNVSGLIDATTSGTTTLYIRTATTSTMPYSLIKTIQLYPRVAAPTGITYDPVNCIVSGLSTSMQFGYPNGSSWYDIGATTLNVESYLSSASDVILIFRNKAVAGVSSASAGTNVTLTKLPPAPTLTVDFSRDVITGFSSDRTYEIGINSTTTWSTASLSNNEFSLVNYISTYQTNTLYFRAKKTSTLPATAPFQIVIGPRPIAPSTPQFVYNNVYYPNRVVMTGLSSTMEYRISTDSSWTNCTGDDVILDIPSTSLTYYVRIKSLGGTSPASQNKTLMLYARQAAPSATLNIITETVGTVSSEMEVSTDGVNYTSIPSGVTAYNVSGLIDATTSGTTMLYIRMATTSTMPYSLSKAIPLYPRAATPTGITYDPVNCIVSGLSASMQFGYPNGSSWYDIGATTMNVESYLSSTSDVILIFRNKAVAGVSSASVGTNVTLNKLPPAPVLTLDLAREVITGFTGGRTYEYAANSTYYWNPITLYNNEFSIANYISTYATNTFYIKAKKTGTLPASAYCTIVIGPRPAAPSTPQFVYNNANYPGKAVLNGVNSTMEYMVNGGSTWTSCTADTMVFDLPSTSITYLVRIKGQGSVTPPSESRAINLLATPAAPNVTIDMNNETVGTLIPYMEVSSDGINYTAITTTITSYSITSLIDVTTSGTTTFYVRYAAASTSPASLNKTFVLYPRASAPTGISYDSVSHIVSGVSTAMQYRIQGGTTWTAFTSTTLNATSLIGKIIEIRYAPVSGVSSASQAVAVSIN